MAEQVLRPVLVGGPFAVGAVAVASVLWDVSVARGILAGGVWNLVNLWCLARTLRVWFGASSRAHTVKWILVKFPLLYLVAIGILLSPGVSAVGFGIGFSVVLAIAISATVLHLQRELRSLSSHGS